MNMKYKHVVLPQTGESKVLQVVEDVVHAHELLENAEVQGKLVLIPNT